MSLASCRAAPSRVNVLAVGHRCTTKLDIPVRTAAWQAAVLLSLGHKTVPSGSYLFLKDCSQRSQLRVADRSLGRVARAESFLTGFTASPHPTFHYMKSGGPFMTRVLEHKSYGGKSRSIGKMLRSLNRSQVHRAEGGRVELPRLFTARPGSNRVPSPIGLPIHPRPVGRSRLADPCRRDLHRT